MKQTIKQITIFISLLVLINNVSMAQRPMAIPLPAAKPSSSASQGIAQFKSIRHGFGEINEEDGPVSHTFEFTNIGKGPLRILNVLTTCGCTISEWTTTDVPPGGSGYIKGIFDPKNRPGTFSKNLTVFFNGTPEREFLYLDGDVKGYQSGLYDIFNVKVGHIRFTKNVIEIKEIKESNIDTLYVSAFNATRKKVTIYNMYGTTRAKVLNEATTLMPETGEDIMIVYNPMLSKVIGNVTDEVRLLTDDDSIPTKIITIKANIIQDFDTLTEAELKKAPVIQTPIEIDLGEVYIGEVVSRNLMITNMGKSNLVVRRAADNCDCITTHIPATPIKKGKSAPIKIEFNAKGLRGDQVKTITIIANDPKRSVIDVKLKAKVIIPGVDPVAK